MPRLSIYVLRQLAEPIGLFAFLLTSVVWLSQSLRLLDLVINRGQSAPTFVWLTILLLPTLLVIILPLAYFAGTLYGLHKLNSESELVVMSSAGYSRAQLAVPVLVAAAIVMLLTWLCSLYLMPLGQRTMKDKVMSIRADIGAAVLSEGMFNTPADGLTVFVRELSSDGHIRGILVHDNRKPENPTSYLAKSGVLAQTPAGARLIMQDGTIEQSGKSGAQLSVLKFERYVFDLDQFGDTGPRKVREASERYLPELLWPDLPKDPRQEKARRMFIAEAHNRLTAPLYCIAFALIALVAVTRGRRARGANVLRLTAAAAAAGLLRLVGYGAVSLAGRNPYLGILLYLIPTLGAGIAAAALADIDFARIFGRRAPAAMENAP
ncbi:MAG: LPS export ABC transporter permease LptF [Alphaproteobacteria bacterium]|nr:LPS export ABC transporter permease LptF [Alphaproteobacteria bacterium]